MIKQWCIGFASKLSEHNFVPTEEIEVYAYGLQFGFEMLINLLTTLVIGFSLGMLWESTILFAGYMLLRSYTGGYHAQSFYACYLMSNVLVFGLLFLGKILPVQLHLTIAFLLTAASAPVIFVLSPVQTPNKPLDAYEATHHRGKSLLWLFIEVLAVGVLLLFGLQKYALLLSLGLASISILMVIGAIRNRIFPMQGGLNE